MRKDEIIAELLKMSLGDRRDFVIEFKRKSGLYRSIDECGFIDGESVTVSFDKELNFDQLVMLGYLKLSVHSKLDKKLMCEKIGVSIQILNRGLRKLRSLGYIFGENNVGGNFNEDMGSVVIDDLILSLPIKSTAKLLYSYLVNWRKVELQVSNSKITEDTGLKPTSIAKYLKELVEAELIDVEISDVVGSSKRIIKIK